MYHHQQPTLYLDAEVDDLLPHYYSEKVILQEQFQLVEYSEEKFYPKLENSII
jgi:hypothetical protein